MFEIHPKSRIQYCERSELRLHFKYQKFIESAKNGQFGNFLKNWSYLKTVLPDRPISKGQKLVKRAKIEKLTMRHFGRFSTIVRMGKKRAHKSLVWYEWWWKRLLLALHQFQFTHLLPSSFVLTHSFGWFSLCIGRFCTGTFSISVQFSFETKKRLLVLK